MAKISVAETRRLIAFIEAAAPLQAAVFRAVIPRSTLSAWRKGQRPTQLRVSRLLRAAGVSWHVFKKTARVALPQSGIPTQAVFAWCLLDRLRSSHGLLARTIGTADPDAAWVVQVNDFELVLRATGWCELYKGSHLLLSAVQGRAVLNVLVDVLKPVTAKRKAKTTGKGIEISSLQTKLRGVHK